MVQYLRRLIATALVISMPIFQADAQSKKSSSVSKIPAASTLPESNISVRDAAETEIKTPPASSTRSQGTATTGALSPEQTATMLQLQDPFEAPRLRDFEWGFGVFLSSQKPQGTVEVSGVGTQNLGSLSSNLTPSISLGTLYGLNEGSMGTLELGLEAEAGFYSQKSSITTVTGTQIDGRVNSTLMDGRLLARWGQAWKSKFHVRGGIGMGRYTVTQTSDNSLARWSKDGGLTTYLLGFDYKLGRRWMAQLNYRSFSQRGAFPDGLQTPASFAELGAQVVW